MRRMRRLLTRRRLYVCLQHDRQPIEGRRQQLACDTVMEGWPRCSLNRTRRVPARLDAHVQLPGAGAGNERFLRHDRRSTTCFSEPDMCICPRKPLWKNDDCRSCSELCCPRTRNSRKYCHLEFLEIKQAAISGHHAFKPRRRVIVNSGFLKSSIPLFHRIR